MLEVAAKSGAERRTSRDAHRVPARILAATAAGRAPAISLTGLFERARYSRQPVGESMRFRRDSSLSTRFARVCWEPSLDARALGDLLHDGSDRRHRSRHRARSRCTRSGGDRARCGGALGLAGACAGSIASRPRSSRLAGAPRRRRPFEEPTDAGAAGFVALESSLRFGASTAGDFYAQVRPGWSPSLGRASPPRCGTSDRERSVQLLGADAYALVDPDGAPPEDRFKPVSPSTGAPVP